MKLSIYAENALKLQQIIANIELPGQEELTGGFNEDGEFYAQVMGKIRRVVVTIIDNVACQLSIIDTEKDEEVSIYSIPVDATDYTLKDIVRNAINYIRI